MIIDESDFPPRSLNHPSLKFGRDPLIVFEISDELAAMGTYRKGSKGNGLPTFPANHVSTVSLDPAVVGNVANMSILW